MDEDIMKAIDQVVAQTEQSERKATIEAYIQDVVTNSRINIKSNLMTGCIELPQPTKKELELWSEVNRARFALKASEVVAILLRKELLGE